MFAALFVMTLAAGPSSPVEKTWPVMVAPAVVVDESVFEADIQETEDGDEPAEADGQAPIAYSAHGFAPASLPEDGLSEAEVRKNP